MSGRTHKHNERFRGREEITVYGKRAVQEALASDSVEVRRVAVARELAKDFRDALRDACVSRGGEFHVETLRRIGQISGDPRNDQGVAALIELRRVMDAEEFLASPPRTCRLVALDGVTNPQNVGMIVRSVVAAGMDGMIWPLAGAPWVSGLIIKASAASVYRCPIVKVQSLAEGLTMFRRAGFRVVGLEMQSGVSLFDWRPAQRTVIVVGNEAEGISPDVDALLDERVRIPMQGGVESLNAAVAASLVCFRAVSA